MGDVGSLSPYFSAPREYRFILVVASFLDQATERTGGSFLRHRSCHRYRCPGAGRNVEVMGWEAAGSTEAASLGGSERDEGDGRERKSEKENSTWGLITAGRPMRRAPSGGRPVRQPSSPFRTKLGRIARFRPTLHRNPTRPPCAAADTAVEPCGRTATVIRAAVHGPCQQRTGARR